MVRVLTVKLISALLFIVFPWHVASFSPSRRLRPAHSSPVTTNPPSLQSLTAVASHLLEEENFSYRMVRSKAGTIIWAGPPLAALIAFNGYGITSKVFHDTVQFLSNNNWIPVDGGALLATIITPAVNGPVMTSLSILFGSLSAMTVSSLYDRQNEIRRSLVSEVEEIRHLAVMVQSFPEKYRNKANKYLTKLIERVTSDVIEGEVSVSSIRNRNMDRMLQLLNDLSTKGLTEPETAVSDNILGGCYSDISNLNTHRSNLITALQATFPPLHYVTLTLLGSAICCVFLVETDRDVLLFLAAFQLKALWALLIGIFSLLAVVIYDLNEPFHGTYKIIDITPSDLGEIMEYITDPLDEDF